MLRGDLEAESKSPSVPRGDRRARAAGRGPAAPTALILSGLSRARRSLKWRSMQPASFVFPLDTGGRADMVVDAAERLPGSGAPDRRPSAKEVLVPFEAAAGFAALFSGRLLASLAMTRACWALRCKSDGKLMIPFPAV